MARTPTFDRLASEGVLFERAVSVAPITLPAHVSLLTGRYPFAHGVRNNGNFRVADDVPTLATALHDRGYRTAAFVSAFILTGARAYRGDSTVPTIVSTPASRSGRMTRSRGAAIGQGQLAENWVAKQVDDPAADRPPFFVWLHLSQIRTIPTRRQRRSPSRSGTVPTTAKSRSMMPSSDPLSSG